MFKTSITFASISTRTDKNGNKYAVSQGATQTNADGSTRTLTVMAFGKARETILASLRKGRTVDLMVRRDGGTLNVVGYPKARQAA